MYKRYYAEPGGIEFDTEDECRRYELAVEALGHICKEAGDIKLFMGNDDDEYNGDEEEWCTLSIEAIEHLAKKYNMELWRVRIILRCVSFSWLVNPDFDKIIAIYNDIQAYIRTTEKIDEYIGDEPDN